jgi:hypothetical protein
MEINDSSMLMKYSSTYGFYFGLYWVFKYIFLILGYKIPSLFLVYYALSIAVPFIAYSLTKRYRSDIGGGISFSHAWRFGTMLYFFAALIVSVPQFIFYRFLVPENFLSDSMLEIVKLLEEMKLDEQILESIREINITPIHLVIQGIFNNIFYGLILSIPVALFVKKGVE